VRSWRVSGVKPATDPQHPRGVAATRVMCREIGEVPSPPQLTPCADWLRSQRRRNGVR
jgi:hypothetical protein